MYFTLSPREIARNVNSIIREWGFYTKTNQSASSESQYIGLNVGTKINPKYIYIRISDHPPQREARVEYDVQASYRRENCLTYPRLIEVLAGKLEKDIPPLCKLLLQPENYKPFAIQLQKNSQHKVRRSKVNQRFYP